MLAAALIALAACAEQPRSADMAAHVEVPEPSGPPLVQQVRTEESGPSASALSWESVASGEGMTLRLADADGKLRMSIACFANPPRLTASVPGFSPIGSEDKLTLALGDDPVVLVADPTRQQVPGVTGEGRVPDDLAVLMRDAGEVGAVYGAQRVGPHLPPPPALASAFASACAEAAT